MVALNPEHTGCGNGSATLYAFPGPRSKIVVRHLPFSRDWYADGEIEVGKVSIPRRTRTLPLRLEILILVALSLAWDIVAMRIIYLICGDNWPWSLWVHGFSSSASVFAITSAPFRLQHDGLGLLKSTEVDYFDGNNTKLTGAVVDTTWKMSNDASGETYNDIRVCGQDKDKNRRGSRVGIITLANSKVRSKAR